VSGGTSLQVADPFGNVENVPVQNGQAIVSATQLPHYLLLTAGQTVTMPQVNFGTNLTDHASFTYSAPSKSNTAWLTDGIVESFHNTSPNPAQPIWTGDLPVTAEGDIVPQTLEISFDQAYEIDKLLIRSVRADNPYCSLLDYDLEYLSNGTWQPLETVRTPMAPSEWASGSGTVASAWYQDNNFFVHQFVPIKTSKIRLVAHRSTFGFTPDKLAHEAMKKTWGHAGLAPKLMLREIEVYGTFPENVDPGSGPAIGNGDGLTVTYFDNIDFTGKSLTRIDPTVNFSWGGTSPDSSISIDTFSGRWEGKLMAQYSEPYTFYGLADDGISVWIDNKLLITRSNGSATVNLQAGVKYDIKVEYYERCRWSLHQSVLEQPFHTQTDRA
jgi:hypothetical protein